MPVTSALARAIAGALAPVLLPALVAAQDAAPVAAAAPPALRLQSFTIVVPDYDEAKRWYVEKLGFEVVRDQAFGRSGERFILVAPAGQRDVGIVLQRARRPADAPAEPGMTADYTSRIGTAVNLVLRSINVTAYADSLTRRGVTLTSPPRQMPWGGEATFRDLYGNSFVVVGPLGRD